MKSPFNLLFLIFPSLLKIELLNHCDYWITDRIRIFYKHFLLLKCIYKLFFILFFYNKCGNSKITLIVINKSTVCTVLNINESIQCWQKFCISSRYLAIKKQNNDLLIQIIVCSLDSLVSPARGFSMENKSWRDRAFVSFIHKTVTIIMRERDLASWCVSINRPIKYDSWQEKLSIITCVLF